MGLFCPILNFDLFKSGLESVKLLGELLGQLVAELSIILADARTLFEPKLLIDAEDVLKGIQRHVRALKVDVLGSGLEAELGLNSVLLAEAAAEYLLNNA